MEIKIVIDEINYGDLAEKFLPYLAQKDLLGGALGGISKMPSRLTRSLVDALPKEKKDELAVMLLEKNKSRILDKAERLAREQDVEVHFSDLIVTR